MTERPDERLVEDPVRRQRYRFTTRGAVLQFQVWADPRADVPEHIHPHQEERFQILGGQVRFIVDGGERLASQGERLVVPAGVPHAFENTGSEQARMLVEVEPALDLQEFLERAAELARARKYTRRGVPRSPRAALELAVLADEFKETTVMTRPPRFVQRIALAPLARLGRALGYGTKR